MTNDSWLRDLEFESADGLIERLAALAAQTKLEAGDVLVHRERSIAGAVRELRNRANMSQAELARRMSELGFELSQSTVAKLENGRRPIRLAEFFALAQIFAVPDVALLLGSYRAIAETSEDWLEGARSRLQIEIERRQDAENKMREAVQHYAKTYSEADASITWLSAQMLRAGAEATRDATGTDRDD